MSRASKLLAASIAARFDETNPRAVLQIERMARTMGEPWVLEVADEAERLLSCNATFVARQDGAERSRGGVFFVCARIVGKAALDAGKLERSAYYRCFFDNAPKLREQTPQRKPRTKPKPVERKPPRRVPMPAPEVYVVRPRAATAPK